MLLFKYFDKFGVYVFYDMNEGFKDCDVIIMLWLQNEWMIGVLLFLVGEYFCYYGLMLQKLVLVKLDVIVMYFGLMNCGVEIYLVVVDGLQVVILFQVIFGIVVWMVVMSIVVGN